MQKSVILARGLLTKDNLWSKAISGAEKINENAKTARTSSRHSVRNKPQKDT